MPHISDARPTVTAKLGKNHTVQADGDTWDEILAVYEKSKRSNSTANSSSFLGGTLSYFGGKKKNNKNKNNNTSSNTGSKSNSKSVLIIRSYYQNRRTNKKVWDEPPSGASHIITASDEMRRMVEIQMNDLCVMTTCTSGIEEEEDENNDSHIAGTNATNTNNTNINNRNVVDRKKKSLVSGLFRRRISSDGTNNIDSAGSASNIKRIRYKSGSKVLSTMNGIDDVDTNNIGRSGNGTLNERQLQEAIARSITDTGSFGDYGETEDETLQRVLEESKLEAV